MELFGLEIDYKNKPPLDEEFIPILLWNQVYLSYAREPLTIALTAGEHQCTVYRTKIQNTGTSFPSDCFYVRKLIKSLLWTFGGYKLSITGSKEIYDYVAEIFCLTGERKFDVEFMEKIYGKPFTTEFLAAPPKAENTSIKLGRHLNGYRIGFDAGGTDRKVAAIANGKVVHTEEVLWYPSTQENADYHYQNILDAILAAAKKIPRIDAIGISSAGIYRNNQVCVASLFRSVPPEDFEEKVRNIYLRIGKTMGCQNIQVVNDGDVTALAGAMNLEANNVLGIAMSSSQASGFVDKEGNLTGWLNELCFAPVDLSPKAPEDEWSGDKGTGINYFSQEAVLRLAKKAGIPLNERDEDARKLKTVQMRAEQGEKRAVSVFKTIGTYLGHTLAYYHSIYQFQFVLLLGRVMSGAGGDIIFESAQTVLAWEYPEVASEIFISLPEEESRSVGQATAAASLPIV
ncbi:MAG: ROK family protein [Eubacteriales bacterium]